MLLLAVGTGLFGCTPLGEAALLASKRAVGLADSAKDLRLNPNFLYLKVRSNTSLAHLALGEIEQHPAGEIEVWFSAEHEVLKLQQGRIVAFNSLPISWSQTITSLSEMAYRRRLDLMPDYRIGIEQTIDRQQLKGGAPQFVISRLSPSAAASNITWISERIQGTNDLKKDGYIGIDPNATGRARFRWGYQCLTDELCLHWEKL